eukprot:CAMPEP_0172474482 /NCGR_PEP_ID=MMETSP1065-20121228/69379_1 /TAXON_ID=265537 /ORGANISM="Amphiprora paludosa, Strain CCMP125" /LENGTH=277 /DNA_ID=CAMNT_0013232663 /DNA_START=554 /DNA_END=1384 /DNA_ORIENTATION=+
MPILRIHTQLHHHPNHHHIIIIIIDVIHRNLPPLSSPHHHRRNSSQSSTITVDHPDWHSSHKQPQPHPLLYSPLQPPPRHSVSFDLPSNQVYTVPSLESTTICWYTTDELERFKIQARHDTQEWMSTTSSEEEETTAQAAHCHAMERLWKNCLDHQQQQVQQQQQQQSMYTPYHPATMMMMTMNAPDYHPGDEVFVQDQVQQVLAKLSPHDNDCDHYIGLERWNKPVRRHKQAAMVRTLRQQSQQPSQQRRRGHHKRHHSYDTAAPTAILAPPPLLW